MNVLWLTPSAWWGLVAVAIPIAIHLLTKQHTKLVPFPTLRFIHATRVSALRRRSIHDWLLLAVRMLILATAVAALASPLFLSAGREAQWQSRVARAIVLAPGLGGREQEQAALVEAQRHGSFVSAVFRPAPHLADALRDAAAWLATQPPALRDLVIVGNLHDGDFSASDQALIPSTVGIRFVPFAVAQRPAYDRVDILEGNRLWRADLALADERTGVQLTGAGTMTPPIAVTATGAEQRVAEAALGAVLARGVRMVPGSQRRVVVVFQGAAGPTLASPVAEPWMRDVLARLPGLSGGQSKEALVLNAPIHARGVEAARLLEHIVEVVFVDEFVPRETRMMPLHQLTSWSRPIRFDSAAPVDEGDRRWLWTFALLLLGVEWLLRSPRVQRAAPAETEARVA
jgi:Aerotolerance regulator N-terminal